MGKRGFISANNALFVSVDLIGEKNQVILEYGVNRSFVSGREGARVDFVD